MNRINLNSFLLLLALCLLRATASGQTSFMKSYTNLTQSHYSTVFFHENENVVVTPAGFVVAGSNSSGTNMLRLTKLDASGAVLATTSFDLVSSGIVAGYTFDENVRVIKRTPDGGFVLGGTMQFFYSPSGWQYHGFVVKVDSSFNYEWGLDIDPAYTTIRHVTDITVLATGSILVHLNAYGNHCAGCTTSNWSEYRFVVNSTGTTMTRWNTGLCRGFGTSYQKPSGEIWFAGQEGGDCAGTLHYMCMRWGMPGGSSLTGKTYYQGMAGGPYFRAWPATMSRMRDARSFLIAGIQYDGTGYTPFVMKTDSMGTPIWTKKVVVTGLTADYNTLFKALQLEDSTIVLAGDNEIIRLSKTGTFLSAGSVTGTVVDLVESVFSTPLLITSTASGTGLYLLDSAGFACSETTAPAISSFALNIVNGTNYSTSPSSSSQGFDIASPSSQVVFATSPTTVCEVFPPCTVTANYLPATDSICVGETLTVTNTSTGATSYSWFLDGLPAGSSASPSFVMDSVGTSTVTLVAGNASCSDTLELAVEVLALPTPVLSTSGAFAVCAGDSVALSVTGSGGSLQWYKDGVAIPGATGSTFHATLAGTYDVEETTSFGCVGTTAATAVVTVNPLPTPTLTTSGATTICDGATAILTATSSGGTLQWYHDGALIPGANSTDYYATIAGTYEVEETTSAGCSAFATTSMVVTVVPGPTASFTYMSSMGTVTFTNTSTGGGSSYWEFGDGGSGTAASPVYTYTTSGLYTVCLQETDSFGCIDTTCQSINVVITQLDPSAEGMISIFPNPAHESCTVQLAKPLSEKATIMITDLSGRTVMQASMVASATEKKLDLSDLDAGVYLLHLTSGSLKLTVKLLVN